MAIGFSFTAPDESFTNPGNVVFSSDNHGVFSDQSGSTLINNGTIFSGASTAGVAGVSFTGNGASITNNGTIASLRNGISFDGDGAAIANHGTVTSYFGAGVAFGDNAQNVVLTNDGEIFGQTIGVGDFSDIEGATIVNSGLIHSETFGVVVQTFFGFTTVIDNAATGIIRGAGAAISTSPHGAIALTNSGTIDGIIQCNSGVLSAPDQIVNKGKILGQVFLGLGDDIFNGMGGTSGKVFGEDGVDTLIGGNSVDQLDGGAGADVLRGMRGRDILTGGTEADNFDFNAISHSVKGAKRDIITDFNNAEADKIDLFGIDAKMGVSGNQKFKFIGANDFHAKKGELHVINKGSYVMVEGDVNGDGHADFQIKVNGVASLVKGDFVL